jgi:hypothetical protein
MNKLKLLQDAPVPSLAATVAYLRSSGWRHLERASDNWAIYAKTVADQTRSLKVPTQTAAPDYPQAVQRLLEELAELEERSPVAVLAALHATAVDVVRIGLAGTATRDGRIGLEAGARAYEAARNLVLAAACSVKDPRPVYTKRKPDEAMQFLRHARFGQPEFGSYVLTIESPVPPPLQGQLFDQDVWPVPFERQVTEKMAKGAAAALRAARESVVAGSVEPFRARVAEGVSANLCDALVDLLAAAEAETLTIAFQFAATLPTKLTAMQQTVFDQQYLDVFKQAGTTLRESAQWNGAQLVGPVTHLHSDNPVSSGGSATIQAKVDDRVCPVRFALAPADYDKAILAHKDFKQLRLVADVERYRGRYVGLAPRDVQVVADQDDAE